MIIFFIVTLLLHYLTKGETHLGGLITTLSPISFSPAQIRSTASYSFNFSLSSFTPTDAIISLIFPDNSVSFSTTSNYPCSLSRLDSSISSYAYCSSDFSTHSISIYNFFWNGNAIGGSNSAISIVFSQIDNPKIADSTAAVIIKTLTSSGDLVDQSNSQDFNLKINATAAPMVSASIIIPTNSSIIGSNTTWIFTYEPNFESIYGSIISIEFPSWNGCIGANGSDVQEIIRTENPSCLGVIGIEAAITCKWNSQSRTLTITNGFISSNMQGLVSFQVSSCYNPPRNIALTGFRFYLKSANFITYESSTNLISLLVSTPSIISITDSSVSAWVSQTQQQAFLEMDFYPNIPFLKGDIIEYTLPTEISTFSDLYSNYYLGFSDSPTISKVNSSTIRAINGFDTYSSPPWIRLSIYYISTPSSTKPTGPFTIKHLTSNLDVIEVGTGGSIKVGPSTISQYSIYPYLIATNYTVKATSTYYFEFIINKVPAGGSLVVYFPPQIKIASRNSTNCQIILFGLDKNANCVVQNSVLYIFDGFKSEYGGRIWFGIDQVTNPDTNAQTWSFNITTYTDNTLTYMINSIANGIIFTSTYDLNTLNVISQSPWTGSSTSYVFIVSTPFKIPAGSQVIISFPANISVSNSINTCQTILGLLSDSNVCAYSNSQLVITNSFQSYKDPGTFSFYVSGVINPFSTKLSGRFNATISDSSGNVVDFISTGSNTVQMTATSYFSSLSLGLSTTVSGAIAKYTISFTTFNPIPSGVKVIFTIESQPPWCNMMFIDQPQCEIKTSNINSISCQASTSSLTASLILSNDALPSKTFLSFAISSIKNNISQKYCYCTFRTATADGYLIDYGNSWLYTDPATIANINITAANKEIGMKTNYTVSYYPENLHPVGTSLIINIPPEFSLGKVFCVPITLGPKFNCSISSRQLTTVYGFDSSYDTSTKISFIILNIINPSKNITTSPWVLKSYTDSYIIDQSLTITTSSFSCLFSCSTCNNLSTNCTSCNEGFYLLNFSCLATCPDGYISNSNTRLCTQCPSLYPKVINNTCHKRCPDSQWWDGIQCNDCINPCLTCNSSSFCTSCTQITTLPNLGVQTYLYSNNGTCLIACPLGTLPNSINVKCEPCTNCIPCPDGFYSTLGTNDCANHCDEWCEICTSKSRCLKCTDHSLYIDNYACKPCESNFFSNLDGQTCSHCLVNQYSNPGATTCSSSCYGPSCEFCIKCDKEYKNCWNYYDSISNDQEYIIVCLELEIPEEFIVGQISDEFIINVNSSYPNISLKSFDDEIIFTGEYSNFTILINEEYDIINNPPYFWIEFEEIPLNVSIDPKYDYLSTIVMNNQNFIVQSYEQFGRVLINLLNDIVFHPKLYSTDSYSCSSILSDIIISEMGESVKCYIQNESILTIIIDQWAAAINFIVFKKNVLAIKNQPDLTNLRFINLEIKNFNPSHPVPAINSISKICCKCNFTLDASLSTGIGVLNYTWFIDSVFLSNQPATYAFAPGCKVKSEIKVELQISDLWHTEIAQKIIKLEQIPSTVAIKHFDNITTHKYITFYVDISWDPSTQSTTNFNIEWNYWPENDTSQIVTIKWQKEFSTIFYNEVNYKIYVSALPDNDEFASNNETISIVPYPDIPKLWIVGVNSSIYWTAQISFYADLVYSDSSRDRKYPITLSETDCPFGVLTPGSRNGDFSFLSRENENYWCSFAISVTVSPKISKSVPCYFNVSRSKVPEVYVPFNWEYFDYSSPTRFMANIPDQTDLQIAWTKADKNPEIDISTPKNQSSYTIDAFILIPGLTYEFKIIARNIITNATTEVSTKRPVNSPPQGGSFYITPNTGYSLETDFFVTFSGWVDPEHNMPLSYQVFQQTEKEIIAITPKTFNSAFMLSIGSVGHILLIGRIYDGLGTFTNLTFPIKVNAGNKDSKNEADQLVNVGLNMDQNLYISKIVAISQHTFTNYADGDSIQSVISILVDALNLWTSSRSLSLSDVSACADIVSVFLNQSSIYDKNLIQNISWTLENALSQTSTLDFGTYSVFLKQIDLLSSRNYQLNSIKFNESNSLSFFESFDKFFSEASLKYQITTNPNENSINYNGEFYNSTIISKNKNTLNNPVILDKVGLAANFYTDTSQDNDNTIYHQSLISVNSIGDISNNLLLNFSVHATTIGSCSFHRDDGDGYIESSDFTINQVYKYPSIINSAFIKPNITKTTSDLDNRSYGKVSNTSVVLAVSSSLLDSSEDYSCQMLGQSSNLFSNTQCKTKLNSDHSYTCECEFLDLVSLIPAPDVYPVIKSAIGKIEFEVYEGFSWITFTVFSLLAIIYLILLKDLTRMDKFTHKLLKRKVKTIIAEIKISIKSKINYYETREKIDKYFEDVKASIYKDVVKQLNDEKEKKFLPILLTKKRIMKQANDCFIERDLETIIDCINSMDLDSNFQTIKNRLIAKKGYIRKIYHFIVKIFKVKDQDKIFFGEIIKNKTRALHITIEFTEELIEKLLERLWNLKNVLMYPEEDIDKKENKNEADPIGLEFIGIEHEEANPCEDSIKTQDRPLYNENRVENILPYEIQQSSQYKSNWYLMFFSYLQNNIRSNFEPEHSFTYYFLKDNLVIGLIGFTNLNFSRKGRLTLLMVTLFINTWLTILLFAPEYDFNSQELYYGLSELHVILYTLSFAIGLIASIIAIFLPTNYLKEEFLTKNVFKSMTSRIFYGISWILMIALFITGCTTASKMDWYPQATLTKEIFINLFFTIFSEAFVKPICWWCYKWLKYNKLIPIIGALMRRLNCCKKSSKSFHEHKILPSIDIA